jgi:hypothetical protein
MNIDDCTTFINHSASCYNNGGPLSGETGWLLALGPLVVVGIILLTLISRSEK